MTSSIITNKKKQSIWIASFLAMTGWIASFLAMTTTAHAQSLSLNISPPLIQAVVKPGKSLTQIITLQNTSPTSKQLVVRFVPFNSADNFGNPYLLPDAKPNWLKYFSLANSNIALNQPFVIEANASRQLVLSISIPENAPKEDHYLTLLVTSTIDRDPSATLISGSIGTNILLSVSDSEFPVSKIKIGDFSLLTKPLFTFKSRRFYDSFTPLEFALTAKNTGNHLVQTKGLFQIKRSNKVNFITPVLPSLLIANSQRSLTASPSGTLTYRPGLSQIGRFTASIDLYSETASTSSQVSFYLFPFKILLGLITIVIIITSLLTRLIL